MYDSLYWLRIFHSVIIISLQNTYQSAAGKQAGIYAQNFKKRMDTMGHILSYTSKPLVNTRVGRILPTSEVPNGMNVIVAG